MISWTSHSVCVWSAWQRHALAPLCVYMCLFCSGFVVLGTVSCSQSITAGRSGVLMGDWYDGEGLRTGEAVLKTLLCGQETIIILIACNILEAKPKFKIFFMLTNFYKGEREHTRSFLSWCFIVMDQILRFNFIYQENLGQNLLMQEASWKGIKDILHCWYFPKFITIHVFFQVSSPIEDHAGYLQ